MGEWTILLRKLAEPGDHPQEEAQLGRSLPCLYGVGIPMVAFLGAAKPF